MPETRHHIEHSLRGAGSARLGYGIVITGLLGAVRSHTDLA
jgi:hypothetical protein